MTSLEHTKDATDMYMDEDEVVFVSLERRTAVGKTDRVSKYLVSGAFIGVADLARSGSSRLFRGPDLSRSSHFKNCLLTISLHPRRRMNALRPCSEVGTG